MRWGDWLGHWTIFCFVAFRISWGVFTVRFGHIFIFHFKSIAVVFQYHRFPQTLLKVAYFIIDFSSSAWRDFTFMSAWTASASCKNLWESRETNGATTVIMRMVLFSESSCLNVWFTALLLWLWVFSLLSNSFSAAQFLYLSPEFKIHLYAHEMFGSSGQRYDFSERNK